MAIYTIDEFGRAVVDSRGLFELWFQGSNEQGLAITADDAIEIFNRQCILHGKDEKIVNLDSSSPTTHAERTALWMIPEEFLKIDIEAWCLELCASDEEKTRVRHEVKLFDGHGMMPVLRALIYMVSVFREKKIVWGIGRGSSVASFVLFLIGVHKIHPMKFGLQIEDFLR